MLGSLYGSSRPERDFPLTLDLYRRGRLPLDRLVSHRLPLDEVNAAFELMRGGEAIDAWSLEPMIPTSSTAGSARAGAATSPNGAHVNVVLARRGSPTAAAAISCSPTRRRATRPCSYASGRRSRVRARLAADADDEQGDRDSTSRTRR